MNGTEILDDLYNKANLNPNKHAEFRTNIKGRDLWVFYMKRTSPIYDVRCPDSTSTWQVVLEGDAPRVYNKRQPACKQINKMLGRQ